MPRCRPVISSGTRASDDSGTTGGMLREAGVISAKGSASSGCKASARWGCGLVTTAMSTWPRSSPSMSWGVKASRTASRTPAKWRWQRSNTPGSRTRVSVGETPSTTVLSVAAPSPPSCRRTRAASASIRRADS